MLLIVVSEEEEGEKVEELYNLNYEIMPPCSSDVDYSVVGSEQNAYSDFIFRHFMQRFSYLDLSKLVDNPLFIFCCV